MFAATLPDGTPVTVQVSFGQCVKAGVAFTLGAALLLPLVLLCAGVVGLSWATLLALLSPHR
jgi:hypothetical protein